MCGTHDVVVLAAHRLGVARVSGGDTDDGDGRAVEPNGGVDILDNDVDEGEGSAGGRVSCLQVE